MNKTISLACGLCLLLSVVPGPITAQEASGGSSPAKPAATADADKSINTAISDLNYKLEFIQQRYVELNREIQSLQQAAKEQQRAIAAQSVPAVLPEQVGYLESELSLVRSELAQVREQMSVMKSVPGMQPETTPSPGEPKIKTLGRKVLHSPWLSVAALGLSLISLAIR